MEESCTKLKLKTINVLWQTVKIAKSMISDQRSEKDKHFKKKHKNSNALF